MLISDFKFSRRSIGKLEGVHAELILVASRALAYSQLDFGISSGKRTLEEQRRLVETGASKTLNSRHLTGDAIDFYVIDNRTGQVTWNLECYRIVWEAFKRAATELAIDIEWGGECFGPSFIDAPHIQRCIH